MDDDRPIADSLPETPDQEALGLEEAALVEETSTEYLGRWNRLISTTNWEKGRIICDWHEALRAAGAPAAGYTDEMWSRQVGNVTPQHVGRLRRVHQRFAEAREQYAGLYWSHFQAALDWDDAEMWLEGAVHNGWSIAAMCRQRWEALGAPADQKPRPEDVVQGELDEDVEAAYDDAPPETITESTSEVRPDDAAYDDALPAAESAAADASDELASGQHAEAATFDPAAGPMRPFEDLPNLPPDLGEAFESFKLAVLHHKVSGWQEISADDVLAVLRALGQLVLAPAEDS